MASAPPVLVVDDDEDILELVRMALEGEGYLVVLARDGVEALETLQAVAPCLILLDMRMPKVNGWEFAATYGSSRRERSPIVVMSAGRDTRATAAEIGAAGWLAKPFDLDELIDVVRKHARGAAR